jgi:hypothetical protein
MAALYSVGIDLGTTNCVLAYVPMNSDGSLTAGDVKILSIPQITAPNQQESLPSLPSFLYLPTAEEIRGGELTSLGSRVVGTFARSNSALAPERTVVAAKSWLCHRGVNRHEAILPWNADSQDGDSTDDASEAVHSVSPVEATAAYLSHLFQSWNNAMPEAPLSEQQVTLTVPASFDMSARELTLEAARMAGLPDDLILLEEPQAALYHWIQSVGESWRRELQPNDSILVCDCGGGTTDLTLLVVDEVDGELSLRRVAVGNHLLVGGDNMDLALAHHASQRFAAKGTKLNPWQSIGLWHSCRTAKESLLAGSGAESHSIAVLGRGSRLIGGTVKLDMTREEVEQVLVEGFFPKCSADARPEKQPASGFQEIGLSFESDTAITKHVAAFLQDHAGVPTLDSNASSDQPTRFPSKLLFNGGVFQSKVLRERMVEVLKGWAGTDASVDTLGRPANVKEDLDIAVASGAAYYGWSKINGGVRIRGGVAQSYYVGIETAGLAVPGMPRPLQAVCVVPKGMEEGTQSPLLGREFGLVVGKPVSFRFFSSNIRSEDSFGTVLRYWDEEELLETDPLQMTLQRNDDAKLNGAEPNEDNVVPVKFLSKITELGMFELWCQSSRDSQQWKLEFNVRETAS